MQFGANIVSEIVIPNNVPFEPGNDVIGVGFEVPPELQAEDINSAILFYNSDWSPTSTLPRVKYAFFGQAITDDPNYSVGLVQGFTWQVNPSINSALLVVATVITGMAAPSAPPYTILQSVFGLQNHNGNDIVVFGENDANGDPTIELLNNAGTHSASKAVGSSTPSTAWTVT
jgi:hypothetical protein